MVTTTTTEKRERIFEQALDDYRNGRLATAARSMGHLVQEGSRDPSHISYYGLLLAFTHGRNEQSISLCEEAVEKNGREAVSCTSTSRGPSLPRDGDAKPSSPSSAACSSTGPIAASAGSSNISFLAARPGSPR